MVNIHLSYSTMPRRAMDPYTLQHFYRVANAMNNYVAASSYSYYSGYDGIRTDRFIAEYHSNSGYTSHHGSSSYSLGISSGFANLGSHIAHWIDNNL
ncbi:unnamed protein product [Rotaria magnacalcarata]|uniref:Uncharacterized protein n=1 Tax=Rotaria magnacalcarata TaxID=392030 RepID=A0A816SXW7_9BILA|nr:unnamed protein product [Rotaria magnacalcarata]CAF3957986.1 unnamed protein product [Rotaria magnacalcarata]